MVVISSLHRIVEPLSLFSIIKSKWNTPDPEIISRQNNEFHLGNEYTSTHANPSTN